MNRTLVGIVSALIVCSVTGSVFAQQRQRSAATLPNSGKPRSAASGSTTLPPSDQAAWVAQQAGRQAAAADIVVPPVEPYQLRPGYYVIPEPYSPDYWSPHLRPWPDHSDHRRHFSRDGGLWNGPRYRTGPGCYGPCPPEYGYDGYVRHNGDLRQAYEQGRYDADHEYVWYIAAARAGRLLNQWSIQFDEAIIMFRDGRYDQAAISLLGAAERNHADPASRLHAGHALFALGQYDDAVEQLARAFELAPGLAYKDYDIRDEYGDKSEFDAQRSALEGYVAGHPNDAAAVTLLGYVTFYSQGPGAAYPYLSRAGKLDPKSYFIPKLLKLSRMTSGMRSEPRGSAPRDQKDQAGAGAGSEPSEEKRPEIRRGTGTETKTGTGSGPGTKSNSALRGAGRDGEGRAVAL